MLADDRFHHAFLTSLSQRLQQLFYNKKIFFVSMEAV